MKKLILGIILIASFNSYSQDDQHDLEILLFKKEILIRQIQSLKEKIGKENNQRVEKSVDFELFEIIIEQESVWIDKFLSEDYTRSYRDLMEKIKNSPNTKKLESSIINEFFKLKEEMLLEINKIPGRNKP